MNLTTFRTHFDQQLQGIYPTEEIQSFFHLLTQHILTLNRIDIALSSELTLTTSNQTAFTNALTRLKEQEPIQYIIGQTEFYGLPFKVNESVLIPRPETEELVAWILEEAPIDRPLQILEIGTGSGCISISLAHHLPQTELLAIDISTKALALAQHNAKKNNVKVTFEQRDILTNPNFGEQKFDLIVSNPPYVRELEKSTMHHNVLAHEPHLALFVEDHDALIFYKSILKVAAGHLTKEGSVFIEINQYLAKETAALFSRQNFETTLRKDLNANPRMIRATSSSKDSL